MFVRSVCTPKARMQVRHANSTKAVRDACTITHRTTSSIPRWYTRDGSLRWCTGGAVKRAALVTEPTPGWAACLVPELLPGAYVAVVGATPREMIEARRAGLSVRDGVLVPSAGSCGVVALLRASVAGTAVDQTVRTGTGGIRIDACRVRTVETLSNHARSAAVSKGIYGDSRAQPTHTTPGQNFGRWPSNLVLAHSEGCHCEGTKRVRGSHDTTGVWGPPGSTDVYGGAWTRDRLAKRPGFTSEDGKETVPAWECVEGCPVATLDRQSGTLSSGAMKREVPAYAGESTTGFLRGRSGPSNQHGDTGGASRFYPQLQGSGGLIDWFARLLGPDTQVSGSSGRTPTRP